jgi:GT2 family glycosyltransferase
MTATLTASIVLYDSAIDIEGCLASLAAQTRPPDDVVILDNGSGDDGLVRARAAMPRARFLRSDTNLGFAAGQNRAIGFAPADLHFLLSPDVRLRPDFLERALESFELDPSIGSVACRLMRFRPEDMLGTVVEFLMRDQPGDEIDSAGLEVRSDQSIVERGAGDPVDRYLTPAYVFGPSGAAALYSRRMLEDAAYDGEILDESFFGHFDDADLAWRAQLLGWRCVYNPAAVARHRRTQSPGRCEIAGTRVARDATRNKIQMLLKDQVPGFWREDRLRAAVSDGRVAGDVAAHPRSGLRAMGGVVRNVPRLWARRNDVMRRRRVSDEDLNVWLNGTASLPLGQLPGSTGEPPAPPRTSRPGLR